jgi:hypothetical protein
MNAERYSRIVHTEHARPGMVLVSGRTIASVTFTARKIHLTLDDGTTHTQWRSDALELLGDPIGPYDCRPHTHC